MKQQRKQREQTSLTYGCASCNKLNGCNVTMKHGTRLTDGVIIGDVPKKCPKWGK